MADLLNVTLFKKETVIGVTPASSRMVKEAAAAEVAVEEAGVEVEVVLGVEDVAVVRGVVAGEVEVAVAFALLFKKVVVKEGRSAGFRMKKASS